MPPRPLCAWQPPPNVSIASCLQGFTVIPNAIPPAVLADAQTAFGAVLTDERRMLSGTLDFGSPLHKRPAAICEPESGIIEVISG